MWLGTNKSAAYSFLFLHDDGYWLKSQNVKNTIPHHELNIKLFQRNIFRKHIPLLSKPRKLLTKYTRNSSASDKKSLMDQVWKIVNMGGDCESLVLGTGDTELTTEGCDTTV